MSWNSGFKSCQFLSKGSGDKEERMLCLEFGSSKASMIYKQSL